MTPASFEHFFEEAGMLVDNITDFSPPVDYQIYENKIQQITPGMVYNSNEYYFHHTMINYCQEM